MSHDICATHDDHTIASLSRSAGNPLNQVLYIALGVMEQAYGGCSGRGVVLDITLLQFKDGLQILETKNFSMLEIPRNMLNDVLDILSEAGATVVDCIPSPDIIREKVFIMTCIRYMETHGLATLEVCFA